MAILDYLAWAVGGLVAAGGLWLTGWAIWWDRSRGQRRCPKCWYDLRGTPGMRCSECGFEAKTERQLHTTRRRWRLATLGVMIIALGLSSGLGPKVRRDGWMSLVPTTALLVLVPPADAEQTWNPSVKRWVGGPAFAELVRRDAGGHLYGWQWRYVIEHKGVIRTRACWPEGRPLAVCMKSPAWVGNREIKLQARLDDPREASVGTVLPETCGNAAWGRERAEGCQLVGRLPPGAKHASFDCRVVQLKANWLSGSPASWDFSDWEQSVWTGVVRIPVKAVPSIDQVITPLGDPEVDALMQATLKVTIYFGKIGTEWEDNATVRVILDRKPNAALQRIAFGFAVDVLHGDDVVDTLAIPPEVILRGFDMEPGSEGYARISKLRQRDFIDESGTAGWTVRVRGDPEMALRDWNRDAYWGGVLTRSLRAVLDHE